MGHGCAVFPRPDGAWLFSQPLTVLAARAPSDVLPLLREVETLVAGRDLWAAGFLAYEAAPGFDPALVTRAAGPMPLATFGIFAPPRRLPLATALGVGAPWPEGLGWSRSLSQDEYTRRVAQVRAAIAAGDTYQVNLTWRLRAPFTGSAASLFAGMIAAQPVPYAAFLDLGDHAFCSASPELFFRRRGDLLLCRPMKGTSRRGRFPAEDETRAMQLAAAEKERAENLMIVDMVRNDLGRVARAGTVAASRLCVPERYATVWQLTSTVTADSDAPLASVIAALFPASSVTGAPKASTMRLIADLEPEPRGPYTGAIGWIGPGRRACFNVAIRTVWVDRLRGVAEYGTGGGITWDSTPAAELDESLLKASVLLAPEPPFRLLETMRWTPATGYHFGAAHLARLRASASYFGFRCDGRVEQALGELAAGLEPAPHRVRLELCRDGGVTVEAAPLPAGERGRGRPRRRIALAMHPVNAADRFLFHKTTHRAVYDAALASRPDCDDVLLRNERGELTESTRANLVVRLDGELVTPPLDCGLLPGILRERLLARRRIGERVIRRDDLARATGLWLISSLRGWVPAELPDRERP